MMSDFVMFKIISTKFAPLCFHTAGRCRLAVRCMPDARRAVSGIPVDAGWPSTVCPTRAGPSAVYRSMPAGRPLYARRAPGRQRYAGRCRLQLYVQRAPGRMRYGGRCRLAVRCMPNARGPSAVWRWMPAGRPLYARRGPGYQRYDGRCLLAVRCMPDAGQAVSDMPVDADCPSAV